ncbi:hypothetical protein ZZ1p0154 [Acinetobacter phage ZZ1]|uniref:Uncharacterized protein n=1 Tax=Acinetobacter phage ZZ1 TaxID=1049283 RepID=G0YKC8_9CAUD|nr:hypothetical protein ZZ1p0154 [Acinetobacter phage ZZ1]AEJ90207.1 hypothetical protein ZZ1p0154 [Acinetobacter phage ZZ1]
MKTKSVEFFNKVGYSIFAVGMLVALATAIFGIFMTNAEIKTMGFTSLKFIGISMIFAFISSIIDFRQNRKTAV